VEIHGDDSSEVERIILFFFGGKIEGYAPGDPEALAEHLSPAFETPRPVFVVELPPEPKYRRKTKPSGPVRNKERTESRE